MYHVSDLKQKVSLISDTKNDLKTSVAANGDSTYHYTTVVTYSDATKYTYDSTYVVHADKAAEVAKPKITKATLMNGSDKWMMILLVFIQVLFVTMVYGPIAAFLVEMFPVKIRYTSMSLPYHVGNGIFRGCCLPLRYTWPPRPRIRDRVTGTSKGSGILLSSRRSALLSACYTSAESVK